MPPSPDGDRALDDAVALPAAAPAGPYVRRSDPTFIEYGEQLLEHLDAYALQTPRAITIPLVKSMLESE